MQAWWTYTRTWWQGMRFILTYFMLLAIYRKYSYVFCDAPYGNNKKLRSILVQGQNRLFGHVTGLAIETVKCQVWCALDRWCLGFRFFVLLLNVLPTTGQKCMRGLVMSWYYGLLFVLIISGTKMNLVLSVMFDGLWYMVDGPCICSRI